MKSRRAACGRLISSLLDVIGKILRETAFEATTTRFDGGKLSIKPE
jgi:hypothetical protein